MPGIGIKSEDISAELATLSEVDDLAAMFDELFDAAMHNNKAEFDLAMDVFGNKAQVQGFMIREHPKLNDRSPIKVLSNEEGRQKVTQILQSLLYGLPA